MVYPPLRVQMLGKFSLSWGDTELNDADNRMKKISKL